MVRTRDQVVTLRLPRQDAQAFLRVVEDLAFFMEAEKGDDQIAQGRYITLSQCRKRHGVRV
ncbi:MAG: hypothetical protein HY520_03465 [Candidatus Aenigmarchaeota archaeon]|nr:hypothetical protein [Candidatus Aenigmarchaeota archaeon]